MEFITKIHPYLTARLLLKGLIQRVTYLLYYIRLLIIQYINIALSSSMIPSMRNQV